MRPPVNWHTVDWSIPTGILAVQLRRSQNCVSSQRRRYAPETLYVTKQPGLGRPPACDWSTVDWSLSNEVIARQQDVTEACVSNRRSRHAPETCHPNKRNTKTDWSKVDWSLKDSIIQGLYHCCDGTVRANRKRYAP